MNCEKVCDRITDWIYDKTKKNNMDGLIIGISGGIDSSLCTALSIMALGKDNVHGLLMPYYKDQHFTDALNFVNNIGVNYNTICINEIYDSFYYTGLLWKNKTKENTMARIRMVLLRAYANEYNSLVIGTDNLSETLTGYFTKGGDGEADIFPIHELTKGQVYELAKYVNGLNNEKEIIPKNIITKAPSAGLHLDQTDESDLGLSYSDMENIILNIKYGKPMENVSESKRFKFFKLMKESYHKRESMQFPKIQDIIELD